MKHEILKSKEYKKIKTTCLNNLTGAYNVQTLRYALLNLQESYGELGVAVLVSEVPQIKDILVIPKNILEMEIK